MSGGGLGSFHKSPHWFFECMCCVFFRVLVVVHRNVPLVHNSLCFFLHVLPLSSEDTHPAKCRARWRSLLQLHVSPTKQKTYMPRASGECQALGVVAKSVSAVPLLDFARKGQSRGKGLGSSRLLRAAATERRCAQWRTAAWPSGCRTSGKRSTAGCPDRASSSARVCRAPRRARGTKRSICSPAPRHGRHRVAAASCDDAEPISSIAGYRSCRSGSEPARNEVEDWASSRWRKGEHGGGATPHCPERLACGRRGGNAAPIEHR